SPATAYYKKTEILDVREEDHGKTVIRHENVERDIALPLDSSQLNVDLQLDHRQKGLLWYSTYTVGFRAEYKFRNDTAETKAVNFYLPFPAQHAVYDGLAMEINGQPLPVATTGNGASVIATMAPGQTSVLRVSYRSQGLDSWRYKLGDGIAQ